MWQAQYWPSTYFTSSYWEKVGAVGAVAPVTASGTGSQLLPLLGIGCWLLLMVLTGCADVPRETPVAAPVVQAPDCLSWELFRNRFRQGVQAHHVADAARFMRAFNAWKEPSEYAADDVYVLRHQDDALIVFLVHGCIFGTTPMTWREADQMIQGGEGA